MGGCGLGREDQIMDALFMDGYHGALGAAKAADGRIDHGAALVNDQFEFNPLLHKPVTGRRNAVAAGLLVAGGGNPHIATRRIALLQKLLQRLQFAVKGTLGIRRAATIDLAVHDPSFKRRIVPVFLFRGFHHIVMAHEHDVAVFLRALQFVDQTAVAENHPLAISVDQRKHFRHQIAEFGKLRIVMASFDGYRPASDHFLEFRGILRRLFRIRGNIGVQLCSAHGNSLFRLFFHPSPNSRQSQGIKSTGRTLVLPAGLMN